MCSRLLVLLFAGAAFLIVGCGSSQVTVQGRVTANGKDVEDGYVNFHPADAVNSSYGAPVKDGKYQVKINPGKYTALVTGGKRPAFPKSQEDLKKMTDKELELSDQIPADAKGNNQSVQIGPAGQQLDFSLEFPSTRK